MIRVQATRAQLLQEINVLIPETCYYICSFSETAAAIGACLRGYWRLGTKTDYIRYETQAEDISRIHTTQAVQTFAQVRKFALNFIVIQGSLQ